MSILNISEYAKMMLDMQNFLNELREQQYMSNQKEIKDTSNPKDVIGRKKDMISLVPAEGIREISKAMRYGAFEAKRADGSNGYGPYNWRETEVRMTVYIDAILRHALKLADGEDIDEDSGLSHESHIGANVTLMLDAKKYGKLIDDRYTKRREK